MNFTISATTTTLQPLTGVERQALILFAQAQQAICIAYFGGQAITHHFYERYVLTGKLESAARVAAVRAIDAAVVLIACVTALTKLSAHYFRAALTQTVYACVYVCVFTAIAWQKDSEQRAYFGQVFKETAPGAPQTARNLFSLYHYVFLFKSCHRAVQRAYSAIALRVVRVQSLAFAIARR